MRTEPRIMIAGSRGFVGARAMERYACAIAVPSGLLRSPGAALTEFVKAHQPDILINAAAISHIGTCEKHPEDSYQANVILPVVLAKAAEEVGAKLLSFSSDQVYTGCSEPGPYSENLVLPEPANVYARHKLEAEQWVLDLHPEAILLRATWMYDMPMLGHANRGNFLVNTLGSVIHGRPLQASSQEFRGITYVRQVVSLMEDAFSLPGGVYNYGSENPLNMLQTTCALLEALGIQQPVADAPRLRHNLWMDCSKLRSHGICFDTTEEGFLRCVSDYGLRW